jgi:uncharacterized protein
VALRQCVTASDPEAGAAAIDRASLRGFGPIGILAFLLILAGNLLFVPLSALLVLAWAKVSDTPWSELGFSRPPPGSWWRIVAIGIGLGVALKLIMKAIVMPLLGAPPTNEAYRFLVGNAAALPAVLYLVIVGAGFGEETLFRGYLFERLGKLFRRGLWTKALIVFLTAAFFGVVHYPEQGMPGVEQALLVGLVFGSIYAFTQRLWMLMVAHAAFDLTAVAIIYFGWERG